MTRPLRFCFLTTFYPPYSFGGDAIDVERFAHALMSRGRHVTVIHDVDAYELLGKSRQVSPLPNTSGIEVIGLRNRLGPVGSRDAPARCRARLAVRAATGLG